MDELLRAITTYLRRVSNYDLPTVAIQLLLIGLVVWGIMRFLRGTRGARLLKGAAVLLAVVYLTIRLLPKSDQWRRIEFLYANFLLFVLLAAVVAFQPELRRALIQIGQARIFRPSRGRIEGMVAALTQSLGYLGRNKMGAVIAVERTVGLGALAQTGTVLDANLTPGLLNSIFFPDSALHDMGVIVRKGRIAAAGCQFPLAEPEEVDPSLGSRHRAALGLAKDSDAVVLVVSEETGRLSLACEGQLYVGLELENLRQMLLDLLGAPKPRRRLAARERNA
jgi:diadenylate cyclase